MALSNKLETNEVSVLMTFRFRLDNVYYHLEQISLLYIVTECCFIKRESGILTLSS